MISRSLALIAAMLSVFSIIVAGGSPPRLAEQAEAPSDPIQIEAISWDIHGAAAQALSDLAEHIEATTPPTVPARITPPVMPSAPDWDRLALCESGGDWTASTGNGYGGGLQFAHGPGWSTWQAFGGQEFSAHPWEASREEQIVVAERVLSRSGWRAWPGCARALGWLR